MIFEPKRKSEEFKKRMVSIWTPVFWDQVEYISQGPEQKIEKKKKKFWNTVVILNKNF